MRRILFFIVSALVSAFFLWLALRDIELQAVAETLTRTEIGWFVIGLGAVVLGLWTRAIRWRGLLGSKIPLTHAFHILNIGMLLNLIPLRAGELARSLLAVREGVPFVTAATSIVVERLLDTLLVVVTLSITLSRVESVPEWVTRSALVFGIAAVFAFVVLIAFARFPKVAHRLIDEAERRLPILKRLPLGRMLGHMIDGLEPLTHPQRFAHAVGWTLISWAVSLFTYLVIARSIGITQGDVFIAALLGMTLASLSIAVPVSVAGIGPFQAAIRAAGDMAGFTAVEGATMGLLSHANSVLIYAILGTIGLLVLGVSVSSILGEREKMKPSETA